MELVKYFNDFAGDLNLLGQEPECKLVKIYAYNAYFNADSLKTEDVNNGCTFRRQNNQIEIDGVFVNETLEENTIECLFGYYVGNNPFDLKYVLNALDHLSASIDEVRLRHFGKHKEAEDLLREYLDESDNKKVIIRVITDYDCDEKEKYEINKKIEQHDVSVRNLDVSSVMVFGDDFKEVVESNRAPFDWVNEGKVIIDQPGNILKFEDHSIICNIRATSLKKLWVAEGHRGLLAMNLRYYIKSANIDSKIEESIIADFKNFWYLNNGIIIVCNDFKINGDEIILKEFSIVNGGQTTRMIGTIPFENDFYVSCKIIKNVFSTSNEKNVFISKVAEASNTQKPIKAKDIIANRVEQRDLKTLMQENGVFIEIKRGEKYNHDIYKEPWQRTKNNELAQDLYSFVFMEPGPARNSVSSILQSQEKYDIIFVNHKYSFDFLRDILFLEKSYKEYQKSISKSETVSPTHKGLVKNGLCYCLATIGYILKLVYNSEYRNDIYKYRNNDAMYALYSPELAFMHGFIHRDFSYKEFRGNSFDLFDFIFNQLIIPQFEVARDNSPSIAYSNWMKSNTGFNAIRRMINLFVMDNNSDQLLNAVAKYFCNIDENTKNENIDRYEDYIKKNKKIKAKDRLGNELNEDDEALRNELMIYRLNYSNSKHIAEKNVFTDKMLDTMVIEKPTTMEELKKIINAATAYFCGQDLLNIIAKYL